MNGIVTMRAVAPPASAKVTIKNFEGMRIGGRAAAPLGAPAELRSAKLGKTAERGSLEVCCGQSPADRPRVRGMLCTER